jgi:hypothetical protein
MSWVIPAKFSRMKALILRAWRSITWWWGLQTWLQGGRLFPLIYGLYCRVAYFVESFGHFPQIVIRGSIF